MSRRHLIPLLFLSVWGCGTEERTIPGPDAASLLMAGEETVLVSPARTWLVWRHDRAPGSDWREHDFQVTSDWTYTGAPMGYGESYVKPMPSGARPFTGYFRRAFFVEDPGAIGSLRLEMMFDDGFVAYINGDEVVRGSMPEGPVVHTTRAFNHEARATYEDFEAGAGVPSLHAGWNTLAVEVHQTSSSSSDLVFDASLVAISGEPEPPGEGIARGSVWKYWDRGGHPGSDWYLDPAFDDSSWRSGPGPLGYGESYIRTTVSFGSSSTNKHITTFFRGFFDVADLDAISSIRGEILYDDGAVVYINGREVVRVSMPEGVPNEHTRAFWHEAHNEYEPFDIGWVKHELREGQNLIAVEVHQESPTSSDLVFDLSLEFGRETPWTKQEVGQEVYEGVTFFDSTHGWMFGDEVNGTTYGAIRRTVDGGATWVVADNPVPGFNPQDLEALGPDSAIAITFDGETALTRDGGLSWSPGPTLWRAWTMHFVDGLTGWAVGWSIFRTDDGGASWTEQATLPEGVFFLSSVFFVDSSRGWICGDEGYIAATTDGGATWTTQRREPDEVNLTDIVFLDALRGCCVGHGGRIFTTADGGATWNRVPTGMTRSLTAVHGRGDRLWAVAAQSSRTGDYGLVVSSFDGGATWVQTALTGRTELFDVFFVDESVGWVVGPAGQVSHGGVFRTTTGGR